MSIKSFDYKQTLRLLKPKFILNTNAKDDEGNNALHYLFGHFGFDNPLSTKIGNIILKKGVELNLVNKAELTPLHVAVKNY